jgi:hypothetical protein
MLRPQRSQRPRILEQVEVDENGWEVECHKCGKSSGTLMECEFGLDGGSYAVCSRSYHVKCAGLVRVPEGEFICPKHSCDGDFEEAGSVSDESESSFAASSEESSSSELSSDDDLCDFVKRHQKVHRVVFECCVCVNSFNYEQAGRVKRDNSSRAIVYMGSNRRNGLPNFESIAHASIVLTTRHTVVEDAKAVFQGA